MRTIRFTGAAIVSIAFALTILALAHPGRASAGEFTIADCGADGGEYATPAFEEFATRGMRWRRACDPQGPGLRGLVTANVSGKGQVAQGAQSAFVLEAPPGTTFSRYRWSGTMHRRDCSYALQLYALTPNEQAIPIKNVRAGHNCPRPDEAQASGWPQPRGYNVKGTTAVVQRVICKGGEGSKTCSARGLNYVQTYTAEATVVDESPPSVSILTDDPLTRGEWVAGTQALPLEAADNVGVRSVRPSWGGRGESRACDYSQRIPCPSGPGQLEVKTEHLPEGTQELHLTAEDAAGNTADSSPVTVHIDNSPPGAVPLAVAGGEAWRNRNGYDLAWQNPPEPDRAPIVAAHWRLCRAGGSECTTGETAGTAVSDLDGIAVPAPGEWELQMWRQDAAGNQQPENASIPVKLRFDPEPPQLGFEPISAADPTRVSLKATDPLSGVAGGEIALSRVGSGVWQTLPTTQEGEHLTTRIDDASLPAGEYELRGTASDHAGNLASTALMLDGEPMKVMLPLRTPMSLGAGILETRTTHHHGRHGKSRSVTALVSHSQSKYGKQVRLAGHLVDASGGPLGGAQVNVFSLPKEGAEAQIATLTTDPEGNFGYEVEADASEELRFAYAGDATHLPAEGRVALDVSGASSLEVDHRHVLNGRSVTFSGRVRGRPLPATGKLVELQVQLSGKWQTFRSTRTESDGPGRSPTGSSGPAASNTSTSASGCRRRRAIR
ncbi:MAG: hypothetical protein JST59_19955 [Actinobacteria bacterium]|nr:hypothetical protein [Actinomycetota bacterium]